MRKRPVARMNRHITTRNWDVVCAMRIFCAVYDLVAPTIVPSFWGYDIYMNCSDEQADAIDEIIYCIKYGYTYYINGHRYNDHN